jgi:dUTP pyrophosphatase
MEKLKMIVNIKKLVKEAVIPSYAKNGDAGLDLVATSRTINDEGIITYGTGLVFEIPEGYTGLLYPRSSLSKTDLILCNHVGVIDSGYRAEVLLKFRITSNDPFYNENKVYKVGDRIAQLIIVPYPKIEFNEVTELSSTERGTGGFGSTGS